MLVINILQGLLGRGPIFLNLHQLYGLYPSNFPLRTFNWQTYAGLGFGLTKTFKNLEASHKRQTARF